MFQFDESKTQFNALHVMVNCEVINRPTLYESVAALIKEARQHLHIVGVTNKRDNIIILSKVVVFLLFFLNH